MISLVYVGALVVKGDGVAGWSLGCANGTRSGSCIRYYVSVEC